MKSSSWHSFTVWLAFIALVGFSGSAQADSKIASLGVRSLDGEDGLERRLSSALRASAATLPGVSLSDRELSLEQLSLAYGCEEPDSRCLTEIARSLSVDQLLYGTVIGAEGGHELTLYVFALATGRMSSQVMHGTTTQQLTGSQAKETVSSLLRRLFSEEEAEPPAPAVGMLSIVGGAPNKEVLVDGVVQGVLDSTGSLRLELPAGKHTVRVAGPESGPLDDRLALIDAGVETELSLAPPTPVAPVDDGLPQVQLSEAEEHPAPPAGPSLRRVFGWTSVGLGAAFAIATVYSWVRIERINDDSDYRAYRASFPRSNLANGVDDVCSLADRHVLATSDPSKAALEQNRERSL